LIRSFWITLRGSAKGERKGRGSLHVQKKSEEGRDTSKSWARDSAGGRHAIDLGQAGHRKRMLHDPNKNQPAGRTPNGRFLEIQSHVGLKPPALRLTPTVHVTDNAQKRTYRNRRHIKDITGDLGIMNGSLEWICGREIKVVKKLEEWKNYGRNTPRTAQGNIIKYRCRK